MRYSAPLDGIRGIAIVTVFLAHYGLPVLQRGGFGVDIFFTLSGFLITSILLREHSRTGDISFRDFYIRRALRLFPALLFLLIVYAALVTFFGKNLARHYTDIALVFFYVANWAGAAGLNRPGELGHTWSLSVEEQFYFLWPVTLFFAIRKWGRKGLLIATISLALLSAGEMFLLAPGHPWWRLYYGFDTRAFTLLAGCSLAIAFHFWEERVRLPRQLEWVVPWVAWIGTALVMFRRDPFTSDPDFFRSTIFAIPLLTCCFLYAAVVPGFARTKWVLSSRFLVYFGKRSYGLYLWHYWILNVVNAHGLKMKLACVAASFVMTELSYRVIEMPCLSLKERFTSEREALPQRTVNEAGIA